MKLTEKFNSLSETKKNLFLLSCIGLFGTLICFPLCLLPDVGFGGAIGFFAGSCLEIFSYLSIVYGAGAVIDGKSKGNKISLAVLFYFARFALMAGLIVLAAFCTFSWHSPFLNFWTSFVALLPVYPLLAISGLKGKNEDKKDSAQ